LVNGIQVVALPNVVIMFNQIVSLVITQRYPVKKVNTKVPVFTPIRLEKSDEQK
jgi:hypothetical protein